MSERLLPEEIGRRPMVEKVAAGVRQAVATAGITDPADVHYVQTKTPSLTIHTIRDTKTPSLTIHTMRDAKSRGQSVWTTHTHQSMDLSNGTTALGIGVVRSRRNAILDDSDVHWHRQIKACVGGVVAAETGDPAVFVSVSAAHQGPNSGGPVAAIVDLGP
jgi:cyanuric acid amidohydrolase